MGMIFKGSSQTVDGGVKELFREGHRQATKVTYHRGGCLYCGVITVRDLRDGRAKEIETNSMPGILPTTCAYIEGLWEKHLGAK